MTRDRTSLLMLAVLAAIALLATGAISWAVLNHGPGGGEQPRAKSLPVYFQTPAFKLTDQHGHSYGLKDLEGKVWVADFFFTRCHSICPIMSKNMEKMQSELKKNEPNWKDVRLMSFSVDPTHDKPPVLKKYAAAHHADPAHWHFVTGKRPKMYKLIESGFKLPVQKSARKNPESLIVHTNKWALVDQKGRIRGYYNGLSADSLTKLKGDLHTLTTK